VQSQPQTNAQASQTGWETSSDEEQPPPRTAEAATQTERSPTPPTRRRWGPRRYTATQPSLEWREKGA